MPTMVGIFENIYEHDKAHAQLNWAWKKFCNLKPRFLAVIFIGMLVKMQYFCQFCDIMW